MDGAASAQKLRILYHNWDTVTAALVISHEVDKQECMMFLEEFRQNVEAEVLGKSGGYQNPMNDSEASHDDQQLLYKPF